jgi:hypothetical protein
VESGENGDGVEREEEKRRGFCVWSGVKAPPPPVVVVSQLTLGYCCCARVLRSVHEELALFPFWAVYAPIETEYSIISLPSHRAFNRTSQFAHRLIPSQSGNPSPRRNSKHPMQRLLPRRSPQSVDRPERVFQLWMFSQDRTDRG